VLPPRGSSTLGEISVALCRARFERGGDDYEGLPIESLFGPIALDVEAPA
jgi:hypothetical protein